MAKRPKRKNNAKKRRRKTDRQLIAELRSAIKRMMKSAEGLKKLRDNGLL